MMRRAFTLMELMVVVLIIGVLVAIVLGVAGGVTNTGRKAVTLDTIRVLELALEDYSSVQGARPQPFITDPRVDLTEIGPNEQVPVFPVADARDFFGGGLFGGGGGAQRHLMINSGGLLVEQLREVSSAYDVVATSLDSDALRQYSPTPMGNQTLEDLRHPVLATPFDAWGNPIRYVHPAFDGLLYSQDADLSEPTEPVEIGDDLGLSPPGPFNSVWFMRQIRRNAQSTGEFVALNDEVLADSDGGLCNGEHPYFYSAGPDGKVGYLIDGGEIVEDYNADNVYGANRPRFQLPLEVEDN